MKQLLLFLLDLISRPFIGKAFDKKSPFLISLHTHIYTMLQDSGVVLTTIPLDSKLMINKKDPHIGLFLLKTGEYEPIQTELFLQTTSKGDCVLDIGANIGYYSVLAAKKVGETGRVFAFEPDKNNFISLEENLKLNGLTNVKSEAVAVGDYEGFSDLYVNTKHRGRSSFVKNFNETSDTLSYKVALSTLDEYAKKNNIKNIDVLKIDVEGYEIPVLKGGINTLKASLGTKMFVECNPESLKGSSHTVDELLAVIYDLGFDIKYIIDEPIGKLIPFSQNSLDKTLYRVAYTNLFCEKPTHETN